MDDALSRLRWAAAVTAAAVAVLYLLTGTGWVAMSETQEPGAIPPLLVGAVLYAVLALLMSRRPRRIVYLLGAALQVPALLLYLAIAPERVPPFELWGLTIKALQLLLVAAFVWLAVRSSRPAQHVSPEAA